MHLDHCYRYVRLQYRWPSVYELQPNVCVLLDVGTRPGNTSLYRLWKVFDLNSNVAGACGEISVYKGKNWSLLLNPLGLTIQL